MKKLMLLLLSLTPAPMFLTAGELPGTRFDTNDHVFISAARAFPDYATVPVGKTGKADRAYYPLLDCADLNGDGRMDALVVESTTSDTPVTWGVVFLQDQAGNFVRQSETYELPVITEAGPRDVTLIDVNEDGKIDCLMTDKAVDLILMLGKGDGTFQQAKALGLNAVGFLAFGDFNADRHIDLVGDTREGAAMVFLGAGDGTFVAGVTLDTATNPTGERQGKIMAGDINADGKMDIAVASTLDYSITWTGNLDVFLGKGDGTFFDPIRNPDVGTYDGALGDFDGDAILDYTGDRYGPEGIEIWLGQGDGTFKKKTSYSMAGFWPGSVAVNDLNSDGLADLVIANLYPQNKPAPLAIFLGKGDGTFRERQLYNPLAGAGTATMSPKLIDLDSNGTLDIFCVTFAPPMETNNAVVINLNLGSKEDLKLGVQVNVSRGTRGTNSTLESSSDFKTWTPLKSRPGSRGYSWADTRKNSSHLFYRTRVE